MRLIGVVCVFVFLILTGVVTTGGAQQAGPDIKGETQALQQQMMGNQEIMNLILSMQNDPDVQKVLQDPEIMKAVSNGDINFLTANPGFMQLLDKKAVHDIGTKLQK
ncbi:MAG: hypothetical protein KA801_11000 [Syntrophorhabdaceae bacterium]|nr:hypothetical protein [Syntrophorhabdaceae bacterium]